jgi:pimeloyl-ACP methyl ester carboxylesterase
MFRTLFTRILPYFAVGSAIAGVVFAFGLAHPFSSSVRDSDRRLADGLGTVTELDVPPLSGWLIAHPGGPRETIVFVHGRSANRMQMFPPAEQFFRQGYNAVIWDLPAHGNSGGKATYGYNESGDVLRVIESVGRDPSVDPDRIYVLGFSLGAATSLGAAAADTRCLIAAVVADSPYADFRETSMWYVRAFGWVPKFVAWPTATIMFSLGEWLAGVDLDRVAPVDWAPSIRVPTLLIHGERDWRIPPEASRRIFERISVRKELWLVPDAGHTGSFKKDSRQYVERVAGFIQPVRRGSCAAISSYPIVGRPERRNGSPRYF